MICIQGLQSQVTDLQQQINHSPPQRKRTIKKKRIVIKQSYDSAENVSSSPQSVFKKMVNSRFRGKQTTPRSIRTTTPQKMPSDSDHLSVEEVSQESTILYTQQRAPPVLKNLQSLKNIQRNSSLTPQKSQIRSLKGKNSCLEKQQSRVKL